MSHPDPSKEYESEDYEQRLDELLSMAFDTNHPAMKDYALLKMELKNFRLLLEAGNQMYRAIVYTSGTSLNFSADNWKKLTDKLN